VLSRLTLANGAGADVVIHEDSAASKRQLIDVDGLAGVGALRSSKRVLPQAHGSINETAFEEGRTIQLTGEVMSRVSIENALEEFRKISGVMLESLDNEGALLKWEEGTSGLKLQMKVKLDSECLPILKEAAAFVQYTASLFAADPRAYSQTLVTETGATITGTEGNQAWLSDVNGLPGIAVDGSHVYFSVTGGIARAAIGGTSLEPTWISGISTPRDIKVNGSNIFWTHAQGIGRATLAGGTVENLWRKTSELINGPEGTYSVWALALDASHIYWTTASTVGKQCIGRATPAGGTIEKEWIPLAGPYSTGNGVAVDSAHIYWTLTNGNVGRATISGGEVTPEWITGVGAGKGITVDATFVYWANVTGNTIGRAKLAGTGVEALWMEALLPSGIAIDATYGYWNDSSGFIGRSPFTAGAQGGAVTIAQAGNRPTPLLIRIHGPIRNPTITRESDGSRLALTGSIASGNYVEADCAARTLKLNGTSSAQGMINASNTNWEAFFPLASTKYVLGCASATAAFMEVSYRSAYA
jgi:hypothetical protein